MANQQPMATVYAGDARSVLSRLEAASVHTCVTSPPYWSLRSYPLAAGVWGGNAGCAHEWGAPARAPWADRNAGPNGRTKNLGAGHWKTTRTGPFCANCGAWLGQLGLEPTPELYVEHLVEVCRALRRVLRPDATLWLNLGDSYVGAGHSNHGGTGGAHRTGGGKPRHSPGERHLPALKNKDMAGIPWRAALALQADGWYLRADCIWHKPNPMPESVTDRPARAHEYLFLLTRSPFYFYDAHAVREAGGGRDGHNKPTVWSVQTSPSRWEYCAACDRLYEGSERSAIRREGGGRRCPCGAADSWVAHYASFPPRLVEPAILAGTSAAGCCAACGAPARRVLERAARHSDYDRPRKLALTRRGIGVTSVLARGSWEVRATAGWQPTCDCKAGYVPATVLDIFSGAGTTGLAALAAGRRYVGIEASPAYARASAARLGRRAATELDMASVAGPQEVRSENPMASPPPS